MNRLRGYLWFVPLAAGIVPLALAARSWLDERLQARLVTQWQEQIAASDERQAARLVRRLPELDGDGCDVIALALADLRPGVAAGGRDALNALVESWQALAPEEQGPRAARLASALAQRFMTYDEVSLAMAQATAQRLLSWPCGGHETDAAGLIADCEAILAHRSPADASRISAAEPATATGGQVR